MKLKDALDSDFFYERAAHGNLVESRKSLGVLFPLDAAGVENKDVEPR